MNDTNVRVGIVPRKESPFEEPVFLMCKRPCGYCKDKPGAVGQIPRPGGDRYARNGETMACPVCKGTGLQESTITIDELRERLGRPDPARNEASGETNKNT